MRVCAMASYSAAFLFAPSNHLTTALSPGARFSLPITLSLRPADLRTKSSDPSQSKLR